MLIERHRAYLDYNASHPPVPGVVDAVADAVGRFGNASSVHEAGRSARAGLEGAREVLRRLVDAPDAGVVFTSGATEANNHALGDARFGRVLVSAVEHPSVIEARDGAEIVPVDEQGVLDLGALERLLSAGNAGSRTLVSVMMANNETGVLQPVGEVVRVSKSFGAGVHVDAVQALGRIPVSMTDLGVDLMSLSAHKIGGPQGVGALVVADGLDLRPALRGGGQERGRRAGTENIPGIAGFRAAAEWLLGGGADIDMVTELRDCFEGRLKSLRPEVRIFGDLASRLGNTSCFALRGLSAETQVMALDLGGVAVSAGSACSSGKVTSSSVLKAMGLDDSWAESAIRVSLGPGNDVRQIDGFFRLWLPLAERFGRKCPQVAEKVA